MACMHIAFPIPISGSIFCWGSGNALHAWYAYILLLISLIGCFYYVHVEIIMSLILAVDVAASVACCGVAVLPRAGVATTTATAS